MDKLEPKECPCCSSTDILVDKPDQPVYCRHCWLRAVDIAHWNHRPIDAGIPKVRFDAPFEPAREQRVLQALKEAREALAAVKQHDDSAFLGPDREKNARASWRGVRRKAARALAKIDEIGAVG